MPTVFELLRDGSGQLRVTRQLREVRVEDMLGREPVREELQRVGAYLAGEVVMVTGAGGSIGSELCRQIARVGPRRLVLVEFPPRRVADGGDHSHLLDEPSAATGARSRLLPDLEP